MDDGRQQSSIVYRQYYFLNPFRESLNMNSCQALHGMHVQTLRGSHAATHLSRRRAPGQHSTQSLARVRECLTDPGQQLARGQIDHALAADGRATDHDARGLRRGCADACCVPPQRMAAHGRQ